MSYIPDLDAFSARDQLHRAPHPVIDPLAQAHSLAARSRTRVFWLAVATMLAWMTATAAGMGLTHFYFEDVQRGLPLAEYRLAQFREETAGVKWEDQTEEQQREGSARRLLVARINDMMLYLTQATILLVGIAALLSIWLIIASRRATLRQINANLLTITTELQRLIASDRQPVGSVL